MALATYEVVEGGANKAVARVLADASARRTGTHEEREERKKHLQSTRKALIDICRSEASKYLVVGEFEFAVRGTWRTCAAIRPGTGLVHSRAVTCMHQHCRETVADPRCSTVLEVFTEGLRRQ